MLLTIPVTGWITTNCYLYTDDRTGHGFLIDPGAEPGVILGKVKETGATVEKILITHGHFDHIGAAREVSDALGAPLVMRESPVHCAESAYWNLSFSTGRPFGLEGIHLGVRHVVVALVDGGLAKEDVFLAGVDVVHDVFHAVEPHHLDGARAVGEQCVEAALGTLALRRERDKMSA